MMYRIVFEAYEPDTGFTLLMVVTTNDPERTADALRGLPNVRAIDVDVIGAPVSGAADFEPMFVIVA